MNFITKKLAQFGIPKNEINRYNEYHRYYHNLEHIKIMINDAKDQNILSDELFLSIVFHDIIYDPKKTDNEEQSANLLYSYIRNKSIVQAILDTKTHNPTSDLSKQLCDLDLSSIFKSYKRFVDSEDKIFKEYQFVDYTVYKKKRIEILCNLGINPEWVNYVKYRKPKIGIYAGSFNPFHKGHYNILQKAELIFDKVIIAQGINPDKHNPFIELPKQIQYRQIETYNGLLTTFINSLNYDVTLIRGLRNAKDAEYELNQYRFLQDLSPNIKVISLFCDKEFEHISSSACRILKKYNEQERYLI